MIVATFAEEACLTQAVRELRRARIGPLETFTPAPPHEGSTASPIPLIILVAGLAAAALSFGLQSFSSTIAFRFDIGGRPALSWPSFIPTTFENAALVAVAAGFVAFMAINRMPKLYDPVDEAIGMRRASQDRWVLRIDSKDDDVLARAHTLLLRMEPVRVEDLTE